MTKLRLATSLSLCIGLALGCADDDEPAPIVYDRDLQIEGLSAPVGAHFDEYGVLHLQCETDEDCFAAEGYFHASHRLFQMELRRRLTQGRLSEVAGAAALAYDRNYRSLIATPDGGDLIQQLWDNASEPTRKALEAYSLGVSAFIADWRAGRNGAVVSPEFELGFLDTSVIGPWEPRDSIACVLALIESLTNDAPREVQYGAIYGALSPEMSADLYGQRPGSSSAILPPTQVPLGLPRPADENALLDMHERLASYRGLLNQAAERLPAPRGPADRGSNNWVVGPQRAGGNALLANDPHLGLTNPAVWYLVHMDAKTHGSGQMHAAGVSFAGLPGIVLGQNEDIAWGATTTYFDFSDVYLETLSPDGNGVMLNGEAVAFVEREFTFPVNGMDDVVDTVLYVPHHGPVLSIDRDAGTAVSMSWTGQRATTDFNFIHAMIVATSVEEARDALRNSTTIGQNFVVAGRNGDIGWFPYSEVPNRPWVSESLPHYLPLPGDGSAEWAGAVAYEDLPQAFNPPAAYIATANNDMTGAFSDGDPTNDSQAALQNFTAAGYRHERIVDQLTAREIHDRDSMETLLSDVHSLIGERTTPALLAALEGVELSEGAAMVRDALRDWTFDCPTGLAGTETSSAPSEDMEVRREAVGCSAFHALWPRLRTLAFADELNASGVSGSGNDAALVLALTEPTALSGSYWDNVETEEAESQADVVAAAATSAAAWLSEQTGPTSAEWLWGRVHTVTLRADLLDTAGVSDYNNGPRPNDGGLYTVDVANPRGAEDMGHRSGASMRFACSYDGPEAPASCTIQIPGGQRNFPEDPFYGNLFDLWLSNTSFPLRFDLEAARENAVESVRLVSGD